MHYSSKPGYSTETGYSLADNRRSEVFFVTIQNYREVGLKKPSVVDCYQIRTVSIDRLSENKLGNAVELVDDIKTKLANILEITEEHVIIDEPDITDGSREVRNNLLPDHSPDKPEPKSNIE